MMVQYFATPEENAKFAMFIAEKFGYTVTRVTFPPNRYDFAETYDDVLPKYDCVVLQLYFTTVPPDLNSLEMVDKLTDLGTPLRC